MDDKEIVISLFNELGLHEQDARTYLALLTLESVSIRKIAEETGINRGTTYEAIKRLQHRGLVSGRTAGKRDYYNAESPDVIYDLIRERRKELLDAQRVADDLVPRLSALTTRPEGKPLVRYYEDDEGVLAILRDVLQTSSKLDKPLYRVYSTKQLRQYLYRRMPQFTDRRVAEGIAVHVIAIGDGGDQADNAERKWLANPDESQLSSYVLIYGNKVATISISKDYTPYGVVVEDAGNASTQRLLFDALWQTL